MINRRVERRWEDTGFVIEHVHGSQSITFHKGALHENMQHERLKDLITLLQTVEAEVFGAQSKK